MALWGTRSCCYWLALDSAWLCDSFRLESYLMWLLYVTCAWVAGIFWGSKVGLSLAAIFSGLLPFLFIPLFPGSRKTLIVTGLCLLAFLGGSLRFPSSLPQIDEHSLCFYNDEGVVEIQGMITDEPDVRSNFCFLGFSASDINVGGVGKEVSGTALIQVPRYPAYHYGYRQSLPSC
jgi:hypothetical protein